jgi:Mg2+-importing ATPase
VLSLLTEVAAVLVLRTHGPAWKSRPGGVLLATAAAVALAALVLPYTGQLAAAMGFVALSATTLGASLLIVLGYIVATEATKQSFYLRAPAP